MYGVFCLLIPSTHDFYVSCSAERASEGEEETEPRCKQILVHVRDVRSEKHVAFWRL